MGAQVRFAMAVAALSLTSLRQVYERVDPRLPGVDPTGESLACTKAGCGGRLRLDPNNRKFAPCSEGHSVRLRRAGDGAGSGKDS